MGELGSGHGPRGSETRFYWKKFYFATRHLTNAGRSLLTGARLGEPHNCEGCYIQSVSAVPRSALLAAELAGNTPSTKAVVVGGTARWLRARDGWPRDLDLVVASQDVPGLATALTAVQVIIAPATLLTFRNVSLQTAWGPLDLFVAPPPPYAMQRLRGVPIRVEDRQ